MTASEPIIAIIGNVKAGEKAATAAEDLGRELAKAGLRILVYASGSDFLENAIVRGYIDSQVARIGYIQVRYPFLGAKPAFPEQQSHAKVFDFRPDDSPDWEVSFYQSLNEVDGILLLGGGPSTMIAGLVALGHRIAVLALAEFGGKAYEVWRVLRPGRDLLSHEEKALMARPDWSADLAAECILSLKNQLARRTEQEIQSRLRELRESTSLTWHSLFAVVMFAFAVFCALYAWGKEAGELDRTVAMGLLFLSPLFAGVSGATIRLIFDSRQGSVPLSHQSAITTAALGFIAGGVASLLFITAQITAVADNFTALQASRSVPFVIIIGFISGLTLDAVFRKLIASDVINLTSVDVKKRP
ncbi:MAG: hypothetical protein ACU88J_00940 [Gammaproteobacteria bacterium]